MELALFSVSYAGFWGQDALGLDAFLRKAKALGYDGVELMGKRPPLSPLDVTPERAAELAAHAGDRVLLIANPAAARQAAR